MIMKKWAFLCCFFSPLWTQHGHRRVFFFLFIFQIASHTCGLFDIQTEAWCLLSVVRLQLEGTFLAFQLTDNNMIIILFYDSVLKRKHVISPSSLFLGLSCHPAMRGSANVKKCSHYQSFFFKQNSENARKPHLHFPAFLFCQRGCGVLRLHHHPSVREQDQLSHSDTRWETSLLIHTAPSRLCLLRIKVFGQRCKVKRLIRIYYK